MLISIYLKNSNVDNVYLIEKQFKIFKDYLASKNVILKVMKKYYYFFE